MYTWAFQLVSLLIFVALLAKNVYQTMISGQPSGSAVVSKLNLPNDLRINSRPQKKNRAWLYASALTCMITPWALQNSFYYAVYVR